MAEIKKIDKDYVIQDTLEYITLADSFVKNKLGSGHGEAKLYVGNENIRTDNFFADIEEKRCFFLKSDFTEFLKFAKSEYILPEQNYVQKDTMPSKYVKIKEELDNFEDEMLYFNLYRVNVKPPRVYMNSNSKYYEYMRTIALPNISYLSVMKLLEPKSNKIYLYFKIFIDYNSDILGYQTSKQEQEINNKDIKPKTKETIIKARVGQGEYRNKLLFECQSCPFTQVNDERLLVASHIKPWAVCNEKEKIDPKNGFIFTPTYDKLFDKGFITFDDNKKLIVSQWLSPMNQKRLSIYTGKLIKLLPLDKKRKEYLIYHKEYIFKK